MSTKTKLKERLGSLVRDRAFFACFLILFFGSLFKNLLLRSYILSGNPFVPAMGKALPDFLRALMICVPVLIALYSFALLFRSSGRYITIFVLDVLITAAAFIDTMYFRSFNSLPSLTLVSLVANIGNTKSEPTSWMSAYDILYFVDLIAAAVLLIVRAISNKNKKKPRISLCALPKRFALVFSACVLLLCLIPLGSLLGIATNAFEDIYDAPYVSDTALYFTPLGYHACDLAKIVFEDNEKAEKISDNGKAQIDKFYSFAHSDTPCSDYSGLEGVLEGKNLIVIQVESLESFVIGESIGGVEITPNLNSIVGGSCVFFDRVYEQVRGGNSSDCDFMFATSVLPEASGSVINDHPNADFTTLARILREQGGYYSAYFNEDSIYWDYDEAMISLFGYDDFIDVSKGDEFINGYISDGARFANALEAMTAKDGRFGGKDKFYAHVVTCTSHTPFNPSALDEKYRLSLPEEMQDTWTGGYLELVHYTDAMIGDFLSSLDENSLLENSVVVIYGDHCGIHKYYPNECEALARDGADMFALDEETREATVPFIIYDPSGALEKTKSSKIAGQIDMLPTLLYLFGYENSDFEAQRMGRCLFCENKGYAVLPSGVIIGDIDQGSDEYTIIYRSYDTADMIIRSNYFSKKPGNKSGFSNK